jgi:hypothetical protein
MFLEFLRSALDRVFGDCRFPTLAGQSWPSAGRKTTEMLLRRPDTTGAALPPAEPDLEA